MKELCVKNKKIGDGKPLICVPVMEKDSESIIKEISYLADSRADMIEWRIDAFSNFTNYNEVRKILAAAGEVLGDRLFLYTFRTKQQGGEEDIDRKTLADLHELAAESGCVDFVDLEYFEEEYPTRKIRQLQKTGVRVIASHHDFDETPPADVMRMLLEKMCEGGADIVKLAVMPRHKKDVLRVLEVTTEFSETYPNTPIITMSMGKLGCISRLCGENFGSCVTFGSHKKASAPGQFEMEQLADILETIHRSNEGS